MSDGYSPNWSPGDPLEEDETLTEDEKQALHDEEVAANPDWSDEDEAAFWGPDGKP